jgi:CDP-diglyceride synthetase
MVSVLLVLSILSLHPKSIRYQIGHLVWTMLVRACVFVTLAVSCARLGLKDGCIHTSNHVLCHPNHGFCHPAPQALLLTVGQMMKAAYMVHEAVFFFFFPAWLIINNDCWAYFWGMLLG